MLMFLNLDFFGGGWGSLGSMLYAYIKDLKKKSFSHQNKWV